MARDYELGIVINPDAGDEQARAIVERVTQTVGTQGGQVVRVDAWGRRHMAYPIQRHRDGLYFWFDLILPPTAVTEIERTLRVNESVIRHLITLRDPRVVTQKRQREAEQDQQAAQRAAEQAARAEQAAQAAAQAPGATASEPAAAESTANEASDEANDEASDEASDEANEAPRAEADMVAEGAPIATLETSLDAGASDDGAEQINPDDEKAEG